MTWSRQEPIFPWHPKVMGLSDLAFRLCVTARDYATLMQTEGFIAERLVPRLVCLSRRTKKLEAAIAELTTVQPGQAHPLWEPVEGGGGYRVHDYLDYNLTRDELEEQRTERAAGKVAGGKARAAGAPRVGGRFVKAGAAGAPAGGLAGAAGDQHPPAAASSVSVSGSEKVEDYVIVNAASPAQDHQEPPAGSPADGPADGDQQARALLVIDMLDVLGDEHSANLYRRIATHAPEGLVRDCLGEVRDMAREGKIRRSKSAAFVDLMKREGAALGIDVGIGAKPDAPLRREPRPVAAVPRAAPLRIVGGELGDALDALGRRLGREAVGS